MSKFSFDPLFSDHAVLQREAPLHVFGDGEEGCEVRVSLGGACVQGRVCQGRWEVTLPPMSAQNDLTLRVQAVQDPTEAVEVVHVCLGDVFVAGGQSNMEFNLRFEADYAAEKQKPRNALVRMFNCKRIAYASQQLEDETAEHWFCDKDPACDRFSSIGYYFTKFLQPEINVAVGIIGCNWGGTSASAWIEKQRLEKPPLDVYLKDYETASQALTAREYDLKTQAYLRYKATEQGQKDEDEMWGSLTAEAQKDYCALLDRTPALPIGDKHFNRPGGLYQTMLKRITAYPVKGVLWYQGETDASHPELYDVLLSELVDCWRKAWGIPLPFLAVQLAPFDTWLHESGSTYPVLRAKQQQTADRVPGFFLAGIMDLGEEHDIHPKHKWEVARRLFLLAQRYLYGNSALLANPPRLLRAKAKNGAALLEFENAGAGLYDAGDCKKDFCLRCRGTKVEIMRAEVSGAQVTLKAEKELQPGTEVLFAQVPYTKVTLYNSEHLAAVPFMAALESSEP